MGIGMGIGLSGEGPARHGSVGHGSVGHGSVGHGSVGHDRVGHGPVPCAGAPVRRFRPIGRPDRTRPAGGGTRYGAVPRHGAPGSRVSRSDGPSHDRVRPRARAAGFAGAGGFLTMAATIVVTVSVVVGLDALASLAAPSVAVPEETGAVRVRSGETLSDVASRVAPGAPVAGVVDRIMEMNAMPDAGVQAGQTLIAPMSVRN